MFILIFSLLLLLSPPPLPPSTQSQSQTLMAIRRILNYPPPLSSWNTTTTDLCNSTLFSPSPSPSLFCYDSSVTQLHIFSETTTPPLPSDFSISQLFTEIGKLPTLKVLSLVSLGLWGPLPSSIAALSSLEILNLSSNFIHGPLPPHLSHLTNIQTLNLDHNRLSGPFPHSLTLLPQLSLLSLRYNSLSGPLPYSISRLRSLRILSLSFNNFSGEIPDIRTLTNLQVFDVESNGFGSRFPLLNPGLTVLLLGNNMFGFGIPEELPSSFLQLQKFDISRNRFVGEFNGSLLSLNPITYLDVSENRLTGMLSRNTACGRDLVFVNLSANLLRGELPGCLSSYVKGRVVDYSGNCLNESGRQQLGVYGCENQALAAEIPRRMEKSSGKRNVGGVVVAFCFVGGFVVVFMMLALVFLVSMRLRTRRKQGGFKKTEVIAEQIRSVDVISDAGHMCQKIKLCPLGIPSYRPFPLQVIKDATGDFDPSFILGPHPDRPWRVFRGELEDGTRVAIRSVMAEKRQSVHAYTGWVEMVSKLRHRHLASVIGHCFEYDTNGTVVRAVHLIFENPAHLSLRDHISEGCQKLSWLQRLAAVIGVVKGVQFLHSGIIPGVFSTGVNISDVRVDPNLHAKICCYNSPLLEVLPGPREGYSPEREERRFENDMHDIGIILLEVITGAAMVSDIDVSVAKQMLAKGRMGDETARREAADPAIHEQVSDESLRAVMEICGACLARGPVDRPSADDVLWHLQFAAQVHHKGPSQLEAEGPLEWSRESYAIEMCKA